LHRTGKRPHGRSAGIVLAWKINGGYRAATMKKLLKILGIIVLLGLVGGVVVFYVTGNMVKVGDEFFAALKARDYATASSHLSEEFRATIPVSDFADLMDRSALGRLKEVSWSSRSVSPGRGELEGVATTDSGGSIPLKLTFVKENGAWRIYSLEKDAAGMTGNKGAAFPSPKQGFALVRGSTAKIVKAVATRDMSPLSGPPTTASALAVFKGLQASLQPIIDSHVDLAPLTNIEPEIQEPVTDERGYMAMTGHYQLDEKTRVKFKYSYKQTLLAWQFAAMELDVQKAK
jgi:hypothetical protein